MQKKKSLTMSWFVCSVFLYVQNLAHSEFTGLKKKKRLESHWFLIPIVFDSSRCQNLIHKFKYFRALFRYLARFWFISECKYICFSEQDGKSIRSFSDHVKKKMTRQGNCVIVQNGCSCEICTLKVIEYVIFYCFIVKWISLM